MATPTWNDTYISPEWSKHNWQVTKLWSLRWVFLSISLPCLNTITVVAYALPCITTTSQKSLYLNCKRKSVQQWSCCLCLEKLCTLHGQWWEQTGSRHLFPEVDIILFIPGCSLFQKVDVLDIYYFCLNRIHPPFFFFG